MKTLKNILYLLVIMLGCISCNREYMAPPLSAPEYKGPNSNVTISQLKSKFADIKAPKLVEEALILRAVVVGNDESGNIYKQLFIQDETAGINIGIDQNSIYTSYRVGQEIFLNLKGLYIVKYGEELQIGYGDSNANRISWERFKDHCALQGWPDAGKAMPKVVELSNLNASMVNTLVRIEQVVFSNGGKNAFTLGDNTTNEQIKDAKGSSLDVRTSSFSTFAKDILPKGTGTLEGILSRYNGTWQFYIRTKEDIKAFDGQIPETKPEQPGQTVLFNETFGKGYYPSGNRPKIADFTDFDMKAPIVYTEETAVADIRSVAGDNGAHIWMPANKDVHMQISGINTMGKEKLSLSYQIAANLFNPGDVMDLNAVMVKCNGIALTVPSKVVSNAAGDNAKFYTITLDNIPTAEHVILEFIAPKENNTLGLRLDNIKITSGSGAGNGGPIIIHPN